MSTYRYPAVLVEIGWAQQNIGQPRIKYVEVDVDTAAYESGHISGAVGFNWKTQLQNQVNRDIISKEAFEKLVGDAGISPDDTVILYGDNNNWFAAYAFWLFKLYGHEDVRLINGGRVKWLNTDGAPLTKDPVRPTPVKYTVKQVHSELRALLPEVLEASSRNDRNLVDVRSPDEFSGKIIAPPNLPETAQRAGHIPNAKSVPWATAVNQDGTFKSVEDLLTLYFREKGLDENKPTISYCRIGERSSHTWFVLKYLLGLPNVKNYDGSWTEYGNLIGVPIDNPTGASSGTN